MKGFNVLGKSNHLLPVVAARSTPFSEAWEPDSSGVVVEFGVSGVCCAPKPEDVETGGAGVEVVDSAAEVGGINVDFVGLGAEA